MPLIEYYKLVVLQRYAKFDGRAGRPEFWWFVLANFLISIVLQLLGQASSLFSVLGFIYALGVFIPSLAVAIRRLHDTNKSGWWLLIALVPLVGFIVLIVFYATEGTRGPNNFGPPPVDPVAAGVSSPGGAPPAAPPPPPASPPPPPPPPPSA
jgi:uncharacterized membrane protein YhaH (DUF805 family)